MIEGLELLLAEREIRRRLVDYCQGIDTCDVALIASAYHVDSFDDHGSFKGTGHAFATYAADSLRQRYLATQHTTADPAIDFTEATVAHVTTYVEARHVAVVEAGHELLTFAGEYRDRFAFRDGAWRITERVVIHAWDKTETINRAFDADRFPMRTRV